MEALEDERRAGTGTGTRTSQTTNASEREAGPARRQASGALGKYMERVVGSDSMARLALHELVTALVLPVPGALGLALRQKLLPALLGRCGRGVAMSRGVVLRCPGRIFIGDGCMIDERVFFDVKSRDATLELGARNQIMHGAHFETGYEGSIILGDDCFVGAYAILNGQGGIRIGNNALIAGHCHIVAGNHRFDDARVPMNRQGFDSRGIVIEDDVWLGAGAKVLDGIRIGRGSIVSAGAVVTRDVPAFSIVGGVPARVLRQRTEAAGGAGK